MDATRKPVSVGADSATIGAIRGFNRFYTRQLGLLNDGFQGTTFSLTEVRVLYELAQQPGRTATDIARELGIDLGYLSRLLSKFVRRGVVTRTRSRTDSRQYTLRLSKKGVAEFLPLDRASAEQVRAMIAPLSREQTRQLIDSMQLIQQFVEARGGSPARENFVLRPFGIGDLGWITHRQGILYFKEYGWDRSYEALVAEILAAFVKNFDPKKENGWVAERAGTVLGSVFLVRESDEIARLRLLYVEPSARGMNLGRNLVRECIEFAHSKGYRRVRLWTNDILISARRIYESAGFRLVKVEAHNSFGKDLVGQTWELEL